MPIVKILVVDDSQAAFTLIGDFLTVMKENQYRATWASTYDEGIEKITDGSFDVCLIDYELDQNTGLDFIREVIGKGLLTPLILLTGYGSRQVDLEAMHAGAVDYLDKTQLRPDALERSIRYGVEHARILKAERDQRALAEALLDIANVLNTTLQFDEVLERILLNVGTVIPHDTANIMLIENDMTRVVGHKGYNSPELEQEIEASSFSVKRIRSFAEITLTRQPLIIGDLLDFSGWMKSLGPHRLRSYMGAPILLGDQIIGLINLESYHPGFFNEAHTRRLQLFAGQAAVAIQNAFAYERAREQAATNERQRLARDLHDAVSQTLFSASVMAEALPRLLDSHPEEVRDGLGKLARLTRGALAEMRTLLVELRPSALIETDLSMLLKQLITGFQSRSDVEISLEIKGQEWRLPQDVHVSLYRIGQEAMNNVVKHARAPHARMQLVFTPTQVCLEVQDDGRSFDINRVSSERMGLRIMQERAAAVGIRLNIQSVPDEGTLVRAIWERQISNG